MKTIPSQISDLSEGRIQGTRHSLWPANVSSARGRERAKELGVPIFHLYIPYVFPIWWGASWSYLDFPNHLIVYVHQTAANPRNQQPWKKKQKKKRGWKKHCSFRRRYFMAPKNSEYPVVSSWPLECPCFMAKNFVDFIISPSLRSLRRGPADIAGHLPSGSAWDPPEFHPQKRLRCFVQKRFRQRTKPSGDIQKSHPEIKGFNFLIAYLQMVNPMVNNL